MPRHWPKPRIVILPRVKEKEIKPSAEITLLKDGEINTISSVFPRRPKSILEKMEEKYGIHHHGE